MERYEEVLEYWFGRVELTDAYIEARMPLWFGGAPETDDLIRRSFEPDVIAAADGRLARWEGTARSALALVVLLDQFSLNIYRDEPRSFLQSALAIPVSLRAIARGFDRALSPLERLFLYLPFEHAEDLEVQRRSVELFTHLAAELPDDATRARMDGFRNYAVLHFEVVERFGRFPDRNEVFGRPHTPEEAAYMAAGGPPF